MELPRFNTVDALVAKALSNGMTLESLRKMRDMMDELAQSYRMSALALTTAIDLHSQLDSEKPGAAQLPPDAPY